MKKITLLVVVFCLTISSYAQKLRVNLDKEILDVSFVRLPTNPVLEYENRTYSVHAEGSFRSQIEDRIKIKGFEKVKGNGTITIGIELKNIIIERVDIIKREVVKKDKEGKVTSRKYYYKPVVTYVTRGNFSINAPTGSPYYKLVGKRDNKFEGKEFNQHKAAQNYFDNNSNTFKNDFNQKFSKAVASSINRIINKKYGYVVYNTNTILWILDSKKNPEYTAHKKAYADIKEAFSSMRYDEPVDDIKEKIKSIVSYFDGVILKYPEDDKKHRKMRYASYYNIAQMYFYLEMPEKAIEYATKLVENGYDKSDGEKIIRNSNNLKKKFKINKTNTRHLKVITTDISKESTVIANDRIEVKKKIAPILIKKEKPTYFIASGSEVENTKVIKSILNMLRTYFIAYDSGNCSYLIEEDYLFDEKLNKIIGQKFIEPRGNGKYLSINLNWKKDTLVGANINKTEVNLIWKGNKVVRINSNRYSEIDYNLLYDKNGNMVKLVGNKLVNNKVKIVKEILYKDGRIVKVIGYSNSMFKDWIHHVKIMTYDSDKVNINTIIYKHKKSNIPKNELSNFNGYYHKINDSNIIIRHCWAVTIDYVYNDKYQIISKKRIEEEGTVSNYFYTYIDGKLFKEEAIQQKGNEIIGKTIVISFSKSKLTSSSPDYEWRNGKYRFNSNNILIYESREGKDREKKDGVWTDWKYIPY